MAVDYRNKGDVGVANAILSENIGRGATEQERRWMEQQVNAGGQTWSQTATELASVLNRYTSEITSNAAALGVDLKEGEVGQIRDKFYQIGIDPARFSELTTAYIGTIGTKQAQDKILHPEKFVPPEDTTKNKATADRLIKQYFGDDFEDQDLSDFLTTQLASGRSPYELQTFIKSDERYMKKQQDADRESLTQSLLAQEDQAFDKTKQSIISSFQGAGRLNSSGLDAALARSRENLQRDRQAFLGNLSYDDAKRREGYTRSDYDRDAGAFYGGRNFAISQIPQNNLGRSYALGDALVNRGYEDRDYSRQRNDYFNALGQQRKMANQAALYGLGGQVLGQAAKYGFGAWAGAF